MSNILKKSLLPDRPANRPVLMSIATLRKASTGILTLALAASGLLVVYMKIIEPHKAVARVQRTDGSISKISVEEFQQRLSFERAREIARLNRLNTKSKWDERVVIDYAYLSSLGFAGGILDRMTRETIIREEAARRGLAANEVEIDRLVGETEEEHPTVGVVATARRTDPQPVRLSIDAKEEAPLKVSLNNPPAAADPTSNDRVAGPSGQIMPPSDLSTVSTNDRSKKDGVGVIPADRPKNYRDILAVQILEKKLRTAFYEGVPARQEQVKLKLIRFEAEDDARRFDDISSDQNAFEDLFRRVLTGGVRNAVGMIRDWSSASELTRDFGRTFSAEVFRLSAGEHVRNVIPAVRGWYMAMVDGRETRTLSNDWRLARGDDAFNEWTAQQQTRITQLPLWMQRVPVMDGVPLMQGSAPGPPSVPQQSLAQRRQPSNTLKGQARDPLPSGEKTSEPISTYLPSPRNAAQTGPSALTEGSGLENTPKTSLRSGQSGSVPSLAPLRSRGSVLDVPARVGNPR